MKAGTFNPHHAKHTLAAFASSNGLLCSTTLRHGLWIFLLLLGLAGSQSAWGQAPGLAWSIGVGGHLFAVDAADNVYTSTNGTVIKMNSAGAPVQTNTICPIPGIAQRDSAGNYYFLGNLDGTQDFGGITLVGGWTNYLSSGHYDYLPGHTNCFLAKYSSGGGLQWAFLLGNTYPDTDRADDLVVNPDDSVTIAYDSQGQDILASCTPGGTQTWQVTIAGSPLNSCVALKVSPVVGGRGAWLRFDKNPSQAGGFYDTSGVLSAWTGGPVKYLDPLSVNAKPVPGTNSDGYNVGLTFFGTPQPIIQKWKSAVLELSVTNSGPEQWILASDSGANIYLAGGDGGLSKYDPNLNLVWSTNYGAPVVAMILDAQGNRFISMNNGTVARLQADEANLPFITNAPQGGTIFAGTDFAFNVLAGGYGPLSYSWYYQSNALAAANLVSAGASPTLTLNSTTAAQSGLYSVVVANAGGSVTSAPVSLRVKAVELFLGSQMLTNGSYYFATNPVLSVHSAFPNGAIFYTLDGSTPNFGSIPYSGPFSLTSSMTVNVIGYSSNFFQSELADPVIATVAVQYTLTASTLGGGSISLNPPSGSYAANTVVAATANPAAGYVFLYWQGAASGTNPVVNVTLNQNQSISAVFGTTLGTSVAGNGQVLLAPPGGLYPYGTVVRLEALPAPDSYFGAWGNAGSGNANPLYFSVTNPTPTVSSVFGTTTATQAALTLLALGQGKLSASPAGNVFATNQTVSITAVPNTGQTFLGWSGGATGTQNPLSLAMTQSRVVTAHFTGQAVTMSACANTPQGFCFTLVGEPLSVCQILSSSNLVSWQPVITVTNTSGLLPFTDPSASNRPASYYRTILIQ